VTPLRRLVRDDPDEARALVWLLLETTGGAMDVAAAHADMKRQMFHRIVRELGLLERLVRERPVLRMIARERARIAVLSPEQRADEVRQMRTQSAADRERALLNFMLGQAPRRVRPRVQNSAPPASQLSPDLFKA
jgi:hypothetical protein